jgi:hypothetical protein
MFQLLKGDKVLWGILALLAIFSLCSGKRNSLGLLDKTLCDFGHWICFDVLGA